MPDALMLSMITNIGSHRNQVVAQLGHAVRTVGGENFAAANIASMGTEVGT